MQNGRPDGTGSKGGGGHIEKIYQKKSQLEHILLRPDTYIGSVELTTELMWIYNEEQNKMVQKELSYVPGLYKIFDEILVNAADNKQRDKSMTLIRIEIDPEKNVISVWNNGQGIPVVMHKEEKMFVPTMIFGHLLTSSNYNDEEEKVTGGRNGYGAKLCNIFSTSFTVETASSEYGKSFRQTWGCNMTKASEAKLKEFYGNDYTKVTFSPDLAKFKMTRLDEDIVALMSRRAYDVAASTRGVSVYLNGKKLPVKNFKDYIDLYLKDSTDVTGAPVKAVYENVNERWEVAVAPSDLGFQQVSFVNSIATTKGGRHVDHVVDYVVKQLIEVLKKKNKGGVNIRPFQVRNHVWVFINCLIVNPTFDSQTKENMTLQAKSFGSKCQPSEKFIASVSKSGIIESVLTWAKSKADQDLVKISGKKGRLKGITKLEDANKAVTRESHLCTLILTEGDSAKSLAISGLAVVGRDYYGVFPLRGKLLNVREANHKQILENAEINALIKIIGLQYKKKYTSVDDLKTLRYGKVMIMTDQDQDGSHIKGLVINFIHTNWPELLQLPFLEEFITPIVKATKKSEELSFYSLPEFEEWKACTPNHNTYNIKYYKGLGTSTSKEAREYFQNMERHRIIFKYDGRQDDDSIVMAFAKKSVDQRKEWLTNHMEECKRRKLLNLPERYLYTKGTKEITYSEFINLELVLFSNSDNIRSIPSVVDGLKPGQRKVMFTCFKRNDKREVKVAQLSGSVAEMSAYHHGEQSLCMTIVNLAQNYVGSNNINLLEPRGQFGTRLQGGKDAASPRYIFTKMSPLTRLIFNPKDDPLLNYEVDDNQKIEPTWYIPLIPMVLVNGAEGIGTGWSTKIPNHNPRDLVKGLRRMLSNEEALPLRPWYKNFKGSVDMISEQRFLTNGIISILEDDKVEITELPIGTWTQTYKENVLEALLSDTDKSKAIITDYKEYHTDTTVRFVVSFAPGEFDRIQAEEGGFHRIFKLTSSISITQMHAFDHVNCLRRYDSAVEILKEFYTLRLEYYEKRKAYLEGQLQAEADRLSDQARFILEKCEKTLVIENKKRKIMIDELVRRGYRADPIQEWKKRMQLQEEEEVEEEEQEDEESGPSTGIKKEKKPVDPEAAFKKLSDVKKYDYLLGMSMWMLTEERKNELLKQRDSKLSELAALKAKTSKILWLDDLDVFEKKLDEVEEKERLEELGLNKKQAKGMISKAKTTGRRKAALNEDNMFPSRDGIPVEFRITEELIKKFEKASQYATKRTEKGVKKEKPESGKPVEEMDEFDALVAGGGDSSFDKIKKEDNSKGGEAGEKKKRGRKAKGDGMKQTVIDFNKAPKSRKKKKSDSEDEVSDDNFSPVVPLREKTNRRAATKKINYSALLGEDDEKPFDSDEEDELFDNSALQRDGNNEMGKLTDSEGDGEQSDHKEPVAISSSEDTPVKKPAPFRRGRKKRDDNDTNPTAKGAPKRLRIISSSEDNSPKKKSKQPKKKKKGSDEDDDSDSDFVM